VSRSVGIEKLNELTAGLAESQVGGITLTAIRFEISVDPVSEPGDDLARVIRRAIVDDQNFLLRIFYASNTFNPVRQVLAIVVAEDDNSN
jgi:hypothetical protein